MVKLWFCFGFGGGIFFLSFSFLSTARVIPIAEPPPALVGCSTGVLLTLLVLEV